MTEILSSRMLLPSAGARDVARSNAELATAAPAGLTRSMNRCGLLLADCALSFSPPELNLIREFGTRTAIYCAAEPSTLAHAEVIQFLEKGTAAAYPRYLPPKWGLQCSIGLAASATTILLGVEGGVHTFTHPLWGCTHALEQAQMDLENNVIDYALVAAVCSGEDPLMVQRWTRDFPEVKYTEAAAIMLLKRGSQPWLKLDDFRKPFGEFFGAADPLICFLRSGRHE